MCGVQIGRQQMKDILAHSEKVTDSTQAACGVQVGHEALSGVLTHSQLVAGSSGKLACGIQIGKTAAERDETTQPS